MWLDAMPWPSWQQAGSACAIALAIWGLSHLAPAGKIRNAIQPASKEFALVSGLYAIWRLARQLPFTHEDGAIDRARQINDFQQWLHMPAEIDLQHFVIARDWLAELVNAYYATVHVPGLLIFLVWMWIFHRDKYPHWRNGLVYVTLGCLIIRFIRVAPPRFVPELEFVNLSANLGFQVYGDPGTGVSDQYAAMPSIHIAWAAVVALGVFSCANGWWRWIFLMHLPITFYVVAATGHHWWMDGIVALVLLAAGLWFDNRWRAWKANRAARKEQPGLASDGRSVEVLEAP